MLTTEAKYKVTASITDKDKWILALPPNTIEELANPDTDIVAQLLSAASITQAGNSFDGTTGARIRFWSCWAPAVNPNGYINAIDTFTYKDLGTGVVNDGNAQGVVSTQTVMVRINGLTQPGNPGGPGGPGR